MIRKDAGCPTAERESGTDLGVDMREGGVVPEGVDVADHIAGVGADTNMTDLTDQQVPIVHHL